MKKNIVWIVLGVLLAIGLLIASFYIGDKNDGIDESLSGNYSAEVEQIIRNAQKESAAVKEDEKAELASITVEDYINLYSAEGKSLILLSRPTCSYCKVADPIIRKIAKIYSLDIKYLNPDEFTEDTQRQFVESDELFKEGYGTPLLLVVGNNSIIDIVDGLTDNAHYMEFFQKNEFIIQ